MSFALRLAALLLGSFVPSAFAQCPAHTVCIGTGLSPTLTIAGVMGNVVNVLLYWSGFVALTLFIVGGVLMIGSGGSDALLSAGKKIMKGSLIGYGIVLMSWMILSTVLYFILF
ncbi:MAG: hypothetical protein PHZ00_04105 [Candidatus Peribacteraceae bacterium]|nr:hypothetical protein [Candidatus Peribacteraceae bacterium]